MKIFDPVIIAIGVVSLVIVALMLVFGAGEKTDDLAKQAEDQNTNVYSSSAKLDLSDREIFLSPKAFVAQKDIVVGNTGEEPLILSDLKTSSDNFSAGFVSPSDDGSGNTSLEKKITIEPSGNAILRVSFKRENYDKILSEDGSIAFSTNDINNKEARIDIRKTEQPSNDF